MDNVIFNGGMDNIVLIGMPSAGKSTSGVVLARRIGFGFIDSDNIIQSAEDKFLWQLVEELGAEGFIALEERMNCGLAACSRCIIATGGSAVYSEKAMQHLKTLGKIVYLKIDATEFERRLGNFSKRGVVMRGGVETLQDLFAEREPLYEKYADVTVDVIHKSVEETVREVASALGFKI